MDFTETKLVIFDLDGTLYDFSNLPKRLVYSRPSSAIAFLADRAVRKKMRGKEFGSPEELWNEFFTRFSKMVHRSFEWCRHWYSEIYRDEIMKVMRKFYSPRENLSSFLDSLFDRGIGCVVYSDYPDVPERMRSLGIEERFLEKMRTYSSSDMGAMKPSSRNLLKIAADFGVKPAECLVVGDRDSTDGEGARKAGMMFIQIADRKNPSLTKNHPVLYWNEFLSLLQPATCCQ